MSDNGKKVTTSTLLRMKKNGKRITMLTAYDFPMAKVLDDSGVDIVLVGDSLGNVILGYENTLPVTMEDMIRYTAAARRGVKRALLTVDMPFMSYQMGVSPALSNASRFLKECGAEAVKIEGDTYLDAMKAMIDAGIPVMGHLGFTPQLVNRVGGYRIQGKTEKEASRLLSSAKKLEALGVFALVLEMVPAVLAKKISKALKIPVIGIGAGPNCDGQVLVTHDMVGLYQGKVPSFVKQYANLGKTMKEAISAFVWEVHSGKFPDKAHSF
jgi:3-methyl-2-oxobutanoate hydroxymethyltransferase